MSRCYRCSCFYNARVYFGFASVDDLVPHHTLTSNIAQDVDTAFAGIVADLFTDAAISLIVSDIVQALDIADVPEDAGLGPLVVSDIVQALDIYDIPTDVPDEDYNDENQEDDNKNKSPMDDDCSDVFAKDITTFSKACALSKTDTRSDVNDKNPKAISKVSRPTKTFKSCSSRSSFLLFSSSSQLLSNSSFASTKCAKYMHQKNNPLDNDKFQYINRIEIDSFLEKFQKHSLREQCQEIVKVRKSCEKQKTATISTSRARSRKPSGNI